MAEGVRLLGGFFVKSHDLVLMDLSISMSTFASPFGIVCVVSALSPDFAAGLSSRVYDVGLVSIPVRQDLWLATLLAVIVPDICGCSARFLSEPGGDAGNICDSLSLDVKECLMMSSSSFGSASAGW